MIKAKKRLGQHFLRDKGVINKIIHCFDPKPQQTILEIGPGLGALTEPLLASIERLWVVEIDKDVIPHLTELGQGKALTILQEDVLLLDLTRVSTSAHQLRIIGNLPYNISSPLLFHLLTFAHLIDDMVFMLQKEVVDRICASPGSKTYGRLSVMIQYLCEVQPLLDVNPACFSPPPRVMSAVLSLKPYREKLIKAQDEALFAEIVRLAFGQRRKTIRNTLKGQMSEADWEALTIDPVLRAQDLRVEDFVKITNYLYQNQI